MLAAEGISSSVNVVRNWQTSSLISPQIQEALSIGASGPAGGSSSAPLAERMQLARIATTATRTAPRHKAWNEGWMVSCPVPEVRNVMGTFLPFSVHGGTLSG